MQDFCYHASAHVQSSMHDTLAVQGAGASQQGERAAAHIRSKYRWPWWEVSHTDAADGKGVANCRKYNTIRYNTIQCNQDDAVAPVTNI